MTDQHAVIDSYPNGALVFADSGGSLRGGVGIVVGERPGWRSRRWDGRESGGRHGKMVLG